MNVGDSVKIIDDLDLNGNSSTGSTNQYTRKFGRKITTTHLTRYMGMVGKIIEMKPSRNTNWSEWEITVQIDNKYLKKSYGKYGQFADNNLCQRVCTRHFNLEVITDDVDTTNNEPKLIYPKNGNIKRGGETFVAFDYINQDVMFKGSLYSIVNKYIIGGGVEEGWGDEIIDEALGLKTEQEVSDFLYTKMETYLQ
jgi:hypothetical protein